MLGFFSGKNPHKINRRMEANHANKENKKAMGILTAP
jgi:hypothetical protein